MIVFSKQSYVAVVSRVSTILAVAAFVAAYLLLPSTHKSEAILRSVESAVGFSYSDLEKDLRNFINSRNSQREVGLRLLASHLTTPNATENITSSKFINLFESVSHDVLELRADTERSTYINLLIYSDTIPFLRMALNSHYYGNGMPFFTSAKVHGNNDGVALSFKSDDRVLSRQTLDVILGLFIRDSGKEFIVEKKQNSMPLGNFRMALLWALMAGISGFMATMGFFLLKRTNLYSKKLKTPKIAARRTGLEVSGVIPQADLIESDQQSQQIKNRLLYHMLLSVLQNTKDQQQKILITSIYPEEGKEFVSNVICEWMLRKGKKCLVVVPFYDNYSWWLKPQNESDTQKISVDLLAKKDIIIMVLPPLISGELPIELIKDFDMAYLVCDADRKWSPKDQAILDYFMEQSEQFLQIILNKANMNVVDHILKQIDVTYHASAKRSNKRSIEREHKSIINDMQVNKIMKDVPNLGIILDKNRQVVYANEAITSMLGLSNMDKTIGMRPGELVSCIYSDVTTGGCGTAKACQECGAVNTILKCMESRRHEEGSCSINSFIGGQIVPFNFKISCSPFEVKGGDFYVIANLKDLKSEEDKQKELLDKAKKSAQSSHEQMSALNEFIGKIDDSGQLEMLLDTICDDEKIEFKRLVSAENGDLKLHPNRYSAFAMVENAVRVAREKTFSHHREISLAPPFPITYVLTDSIIFEQILRTMLRNALEAEPEGGVVYIGYEVTDNRISFYVFNKTPIPEDIQSRIFEKGFTTKKSRRGLGTYSMKVLGERYLVAKVGFQSDQTSGTRFHISLPVSS